jgi:hypothetical protein
MEYLKKQIIIQLYTVIYLYNTNITLTLNFFLELYIVTEFGLIVSIISLFYQNIYWKII